MSGKPPADSLGKAAHDMVEPVFKRDTACIGKAAPEHLGEVFFEISHKHLSTFAGENSPDALTTLL